MAEAASIESNGEALSGCATITWSATSAAGESHGSVNSTSVALRAAACRANVTVSSW